MLRDTDIVKLAREVAIDHLDANAIQELFKLTPDEWLVISQSPRFQQLLEAEILAWQSATNTSERTKLKAGAMVEQWLPEANTRLHDPNEILSSKVELAKLVANISGLNKPEAVSSSNGFSVTINLGDRSIGFDKELPSKVIEHGGAGK